MDKMKAMIILKRKGEIHRGRRYPPADAPFLRERRNEERGIQKGG